MQLLVARWMRLLGIFIGFTGKLGVLVIIEVDQDGNQTVSFVIGCTPNSQVLCKTAKTRF